MKLDSAIWKNFRYHPVQQQMIRDHVNFLSHQIRGEMCPNDICPRVINAVAGRGSGKTDIWRRLLTLQLPIKKPWKNPIYIYALPTYAQAERVAWGEILGLIPNDWIVNNGANIQKLTIKTRFGSTLYLAGLDKPHRIEGLQIDGIVIDESSDVKPGVFDRSIRPMLSHRNAWVARIGVPKRFGIGRAEYKASFDRGKLYPVDSKGEPVGVKSYHWISENVIPKVALLEAKREMTLEDFNEQYRAQWVDMGGGIYYAFSEDNISDTVFYDPIRPLIIGCDFNVSPMAWVIGQEFGSENYPFFHVINEIFLKNTNTAKTLQRLREMYPDQKDFLFYGDASSRAKSTKAAKSDYWQIIDSKIREIKEIDEKTGKPKINPENDEPLKRKIGIFESVKAFFPQKNPALIDRYAASNAMLRNAHGDLRVLIHPRCEHLIRDLREVSYKEGSRERENYDGTDIGHAVDAFDYIMYRRYKLKVRTQEAPEVFVT